MNDFSLAFTDKEIAPWSGLALSKHLGGCLSFFEHLSHIGLPELGSNRGYQPEQLITQLLMSLLRKFLLKKQHYHTLKILRYKLFGTAGYIVRSGRQRLLALAMDMRRHAWLTGLWEQSKAFDYPVSFVPIFCYHHLRKFPIDEFGLNE